MILYEEILKEFQKQKVKYVIAGGVAFNLLGGNRSTLDLDIIVEMSDNNLKKIVKILTKAGYHVKQPVNPLMIADQKTREDWIHNKNMKAFNFYKSEETYEEVDILIDSPFDFTSAIKDALKIQLRGLKLCVISPKKFIEMKKKAGRDKDLLDVKAIKIARGMK